MLRNPPTSGACLLRSLLVALMLICVSSLPACQIPPKEETPPTPEPVPPAAPLIDEEQLYQWLAAADAAIAAEHLTYPESGSAYAIYRQILDIDPEQEDALRGLERIVETFVAMCMEALEERQFATARSLLARARVILPDHPSIEPTAAQIRLLEEADRTRLTINQSALAARHSSLIDELGALARSAATRNCRFTISAGNDAQGRWIYQTLSRATPQVRLRAEMQISLPPRVERLCFPD